jgi:hypothetical protein
MLIIVIRMLPLLNSSRTYCHSRFSNNHRLQIFPQFRPGSREALTRDKL